MPPICVHPSSDLKIGMIHKIRVDCHEIFGRVEFGPAGPNISDIFGSAGLFLYPD